MDLLDYIEDRSSKYFSAGKNIRDPRYFDLSFIPESIYLREEADDIIKAISFYLGSKLRPHLNVQGGKGSGKTTTVKFLLSNILSLQEKKGNIKKEDYQVFYISCRENPTSYKIYSAITGQKIGDPNLVEAFIDTLNAKKYTFLVLDEADFLRDVKPYNPASDYRQKDADAIFTVTRNTHAFLITIAQNVQFFDQLDPATQSSFLPIHVIFRPYRKEELFHIMKDRAEKGLYRYSLSIIEKMAEEIAENYLGDARIAIRALMFMGDEWLDELVPEAIRSAVRSVVVDSIKNLSDKEVYLLSLIPDYEVKASELYKEFTKKYKVAKATFFSMLAYLQAQGLIMLLRGRGRGGSTCQLIVDPSYVKEAKNKREEREEY
ncbi:Cdc6/Cdc18 family protein [Candidatus Methanodesulfokora washburnensis]|jgi:Cdc6-like AAA superfamily ATPase|uniref:AAA family ATPase n=1 Tax=Candidatus Methanodesulfokora washburnensis TaxID=2478471 RepID=A0A429GIS6_9CREN|nr:AAA family ATPase [Candidatus Methanodesulfokores washburnensis]RSN73761.1 AAA family ATPase [Candidatus Methanodesulfokores washburnensis]